MRKVEKEMIAAIRSGLCRTLGNTRVEVRPTNLDLTEGRAEVFLHGHCIAKLKLRADVRGTMRYRGDAWEVCGGEWTLAGWNTPTTRSRINALSLGLFGFRAVCQKDYQPLAFYAGVDGMQCWTRISNDEWCNLPNK